MISFLELSAGAIVGSWIGKRIFKKRVLISKAQKLEVSVNLSRDDDWEIYQKIKRALATSPKILELELCGLGRVSQDACLAIFHLLKNRSPSVRLEVKVISSLYDGCLLFLISANKVSVRPNCWVQIDCINRLEKQDWAEMEEFFGSKSHRPNQKPTFVSDYKNVWNLLSESLDCPSIADKRVPLNDLLNDFGLLDADKFTQDLEKLVAA